MEHLYIFDYTCNRLLHTTATSDEFAEDILEELDINADDCYWLFSDTPIEIEDIQR